MNEPRATGHRAAGYRLAARLARREVRRRPGRTSLVALLVAVPVAAMIVAAVFVRTDHPSPLTMFRNQYGQADVVVQSGNSGTPPPIAPVRALLSSSTVATERVFEDRVFRTAGGRRSDAYITVMPMENPVARGVFTVTDGRPATAPSEVFLTRPAARDFGVRVGDSLHLVFPVRATLTVTGIGERASAFSITELVLPPKTAFPLHATGFTPEIVELARVPSGTIDDARYSSLLDASAQTNWSVQASPALIPQSNLLSDQDAQKKVRWSWVFGAVLLTVVGIVIAAAFAAGARRQLVTLGQLSGNGAPPAMLRRVLFLQGTLTGAVGTALGFALGWLALWVLRSRVSRIFGFAIARYDVRALDLLPIAALAIVAATLAALVPARTTSRIPVLSALAGRRPLGRVPRWLPIGGAVAIAAGIALLRVAVAGRTHDTGNERLAMAIAGGVTVLLGACAIAPALVSVLEPLADRARGPFRIATRSLARQRTRTGAVVSAVAAAGALAVCASALVLGVHAERVHQSRTIAPDQVQVSGEGRPDGSSPPPAAVVTDVARTLPDASRFVVRVVDHTHLTWKVRSVTGTPSDWSGYVGVGPAQPPTIAIADPSTVALYHLDTRERATLAEQGWLALSESRGRIVFALQSPGSPQTVVTAPVTSGINRAVGVADFLVEPATARRLGFTAVVGTVVLETPHPLTRAQRAAVGEIAQTVQDAAINAALAQSAAGGSVGAAVHLPTTDIASITYFHPSTGTDPLVIDGLLLGVALALVLFVIAANLALSAAETRDERDTMTVVGARPSTLARASAYKAVLLAAMGALLAVPVGFLPTAVAVHTYHSAMPVEFPWRVTILLLVAVPVASAVVTGAASGVLLRLRPVRISTMAHD